MKRVTMSHIVDSCPLTKFNGVYVYTLQMRMRRLANVIWHLDAYDDTTTTTTLYMR